MAGRAVPTAATRPALALGATAFALFGVARTTGSGWLIVILTVTGTVAGLSALLPWLGLQRLRVNVEAPRDGTVGRPSDLTVEIVGTSPAVKLHPVGMDGVWTGATGPARGSLPVVPTRRGVITSVTIDVRSAAPLGLVWWRRRITTELHVPFEVGPKPAVVGASGPIAGDDAGGDNGPTNAVMADAVRTIREYAPGDPIKLVHWFATARAGELMVKELESPIAPVLYISVDLRHGDGKAVEDAASWAAGVALDALSAGIPVTLLTAERTGPRSGPVFAPVEVGRRLARAVPGAPADPPRGVTPLVVKA